MNTAKVAALRLAIADHQAVRPAVKCAEPDCPYYRQDSWDKGHYTPAPEGWRCSHHQVTI
jgi:hypothetical protein